MKAKILFICNIIMITLIISCNNLNTNTKLSVKERKSISVIEKIAPTLDSLLRTKNNNQDKIESTKDLDNLNILYGYRGLVLGMPFDSISIPEKKMIDTTYSSRHIIIVKDIQAYVPILKVPCNITLTFYKKYLVNFCFNFDYRTPNSNEGLIDISSSRNNQPTLQSTIDYIDHGKPGNESHDILAPRNDLISMFGTPNVLNNLVYNIKDTHYKQVYIDSTKCIWKTENIKLEFDGYNKFHIFGDRHEGISMIASIYCAMKLKYSDIINEKLVIKNIKQIDDSLKIEQQKKNQKRFIDQF